MNFTFKFLPAVAQHGAFLALPCPRDDQSPLVEGVLGRSLSRGREPEPRLLVHSRCQAAKRSTENALCMSLSHSIDGTRLFSSCIILAMRHLDPRLLGSTFCLSHCPTRAFRYETFFHSVCSLSMSILKKHLSISCFFAASASIPSMAACQYLDFGGQSS